jgi:hypothetical protein
VVKENEMKNKLGAFALAGVIAMLSMTTWAQENKKVAAVEPDLKKVKVDYVVDFQRFQKESAFKLSENMSKIAELKAKKSDTNREIQRAFDKKVFTLELRNNELKKKIRNSGDTKASKWMSLKQAIDHDLQELEAAINSF